MNALDHHSFPPELLSVIVDYVASNHESSERIKALRSLALSSRNLTSITTPTLFRSAKWGNSGEHRTKARFYSLQPKRRSHSQLQSTGKKVKGDDLASFVKHLDVLVEIPPVVPGVNWVRDRRISDFKQLVAIDKFPNFKSVTSLRITSLGPARKSEFVEMREYLAEVIRLLSSKLTNLELNAIAFVPLFNVDKKTLKKEIKEEEWPELTELTINVQTKSHLRNVHEILPWLRYVRATAPLIFKVFKRRSEKENITLRFDFGQVFHESTIFIIKELFSSIFGFWIQEGGLTLKEIVEKGVKERGIRLCLRGGLKISHSSPVGVRADFLEKGLDGLAFHLEGDLTTRPLEDFRDNE